MNIIYKAIDINKNMANGYRNLSLLPLTDEEISIVIKEGESIGINSDIFIFNDEEHVKSAYKGTGYNFIDDKIYITKNVFRDENSFSTHPRDRLSVRAVLAHEYYGHRPFREEYLNDYKNKTQTISEWEDECRASINAALHTPNLTDQERSLLLEDAFFRAREYGQEIDMNSDNNKELRDFYSSLYGYNHNKKNIVPTYSLVLPKFSAISNETFEQCLKKANPQLTEQEIRTILNKKVNKELSFEEVIKNAETLCIEENQKKDSAKSNVFNENIYDISLN